jgi:hypothetical protein
MELSELIQVIANGDNVLWLVGGFIGTVAVVFGSITGVMKTSARERTRREIAAYIAEGSMTPEQGERLLKAGRECGK